MVRRTVSDVLGTPAPAAANAPGHATAQAAATPGASAAASPDGTAALAAELTDLTRTLDVLATIVASVSDRVDGQTDALGKLAGTAAETRAAAFHARAQTDPKLFREAVNAATRDALHRLDATAAALATERHEARKESQATRKELATLKQALLVVLKTDANRQSRRKVQLPVLGLCALLLVLALALLLPRLSILHPSLCFAMGGEPQDYAEYGGGYDACFIRFR